MGDHFNDTVMARIGDHFAIGAKKYPDYDGEGGFANRRKFWLQVDCVY